LAGNYMTNFVLAISWIIGWEIATLRLKYVGGHTATSTIDLDTKK